MPTCVKTDECTSNPEFDVDGNYYNCHKAGHGFLSCYSKGGGSYGKGPKQRSKKNKMSKQNSTKGGKDNEDNNVGFTLFAILINQPYSAIAGISMSDITLDTGASVHVVPDQDMLTNFQPIKEQISGL